MKFGKLSPYLPLFLGGVAVLSFGLIGCGGGSNPQTATKTVAGTATKGPISSGTVSISQLNTNGTSASAVLGSATTAANGAFSVSIDASVQGSLVMTCTGGTFRDEATGLTRNLTAPLRVAVVSAENQGQNVIANVTPLTELAFGIAIGKIQDGQTAEDAFANAERQLELLFGISDLDSVAPADLTDNVPDEAGDAADYGSILAGLSRLLERISEETGREISIDELIDALVEDASDGDFDGVDENGNRVELEEGVLLDTDAAGNDLVSAIDEFIESDENNSGLEDEDIRVDENIEDSDGRLPPVDGEQDEGEGPDDGTVELPPEPVVASITPSSGSTFGGTLVTITGEHFQDGATVLFGEASATQVAVLDSTQITCATPSHNAAEQVDVVVTNSDGLIGRLRNGFTYTGKTSDELAADGRLALASKNLPNAHLAFSNALLLNAQNTQARFFRAFTRLAALVQGTSSDGSTITLGELDTLLSQFGLGLRNRSIYDPDFADLDVPRNENGQVQLPTTSPTVNAVMDFLSDDVLATIDAALADLNALDSTFVLTLSQGDLGDVFTDDLAEVSQAIEVDFGDVSLVKAMLQLFRAKILILSAYNLDADVDNLIDLNNRDLLNVQTNISDANINLLTLVSDGTTRLNQARTAVQDAINAYRTASTFIRAEVDGQDDDLLVLNDPDASREENNENSARETAFSNYLSQLEVALTQLGRVSEDPVDQVGTLNPDNNNSFELNLNVFFAGLQLRAFAPTFVSVNGENFMDAATGAFVSDTTAEFGGVVPGVDVNKLKEVGRKFGAEGRVVFELPEPVIIFAEPGQPGGDVVALLNSQHLEVTFNGGLLGVVGSDDFRIHITLIDGDRTFEVLRFDEQSGTFVDSQPGSDRILVFNVPDGIVVKKLLIRPTGQTTMSVDSVEALH